MSDFRLAAVALAVAAAGLAAPPDPVALLKRAERVRSTFREGVVTIRVTISGTRPDAPVPPPARFEAAVKGRRSRLKFLEPSDAGKFVVMTGGETWLLLPTAKNPIRVPASHRLRGGLSAAEVAEAGFEEDYGALFEREDELSGMKCAVLRLIARKGVSVSYPVVRVWIDEKEGLYRKAVFLLSSGRTAKEATFDAYGMEKGALVMKRMTIVDGLRPGTTVVEYLDWTRRAVPDRWLDPATAREE
ncbi:MAG: outer membrane lipoprotein-sorting protein [Thermoanaerobaculia bacterium]